MDDIRQSQMKMLNKMLGLEKPENAPDPAEMIPNPYYKEGSGLAPMVRRDVINEPGLEEVHPEDYVPMMGTAKAEARMVKKIAPGMSFFEDVVPHLRQEANTIKQAAPKRDFFEKAARQAESNKLDAAAAPIAEPVKTYWDTVRGNTLPKMSAQEKEAIRMKMEALNRIRNSR